MFSSTIADLHGAGLALKRTPIIASTSIRNESSRVVGECNLQAEAQRYPPSHPSSPTFGQAPKKPPTVTWGFFGAQ